MSEVTEIERIRITNAALQYLVGMKYLVYLQTPDTYTLNASVIPPTLDDDERLVTFEVPSSFQPYVTTELEKIWRLIIAMLECDVDLATIKARITVEV